MYPPSNGAAVCRQSSRRSKIYVEPRTEHRRWKFSISLCTQIIWFDFQILSEKRRFATCWNIPTSSNYWRRIRRKGCFIWFSNCEYFNEFYTCTLTLRISVPHCFNSNVHYIIDVGNSYRESDCSLYHSEIHIILLSYEWLPETCVAQPGRARILCISCTWQSVCLRRVDILLYHFWCLQIKKSYTVQTNCMTILIVCRKHTCGLKKSNLHRISNKTREEKSVMWHPVGIFFFYILYSRRYLPAKTYMHT